MSNVVDISTGNKVSTEELIDHDQAVVAIGMIQGYLCRIGNVHKETFMALGLVAQYINQLETELEALDEK